MINVKGTIGYTHLQNNNKYILVLADMHSKLPECFDNYIKIADHFKNKMEDNTILLEEVPRSKYIKLKELFSDSEHTVQLKNLYLNNPNDITPIDIRLYLIPFSIELEEQNKMLYSEYSSKINKFYDIHNNIDLEKYVDNYPLIITQLHTIQLNYNNFVKDNNLLNKKINELDKDILFKFNDKLNNAMEFYTILCIFNKKNNNKNIIIHCGLFHSEKIIFWLTNLYNYKIISQKGINKIDDIKHLNDGCLIIPDKIKI
jgi:hypothetical protein